MSEYNPSKMIEIRPSLVCDGIGVFAKTDIPSKTIITKYGCVEIFDEKEDNQGINDYDIILKDRNNQQLLFRGDKEARDIDRCGQLINDSCNIKTPTLRAVLNYEKQSGNKANVEYVLLEEYDSRVYIVSNRLIKEGEELYCKYSFPYWLNKLGVKNDTIVKLLTQSVPMYVDLINRFSPKLSDRKIENLFIRKFQKLNIDFPIE